MEGRRARKSDNRLGTHLSTLHGGLGSASIPKVAEVDNGRALAKRNRSATEHDSGADTWATEKALGARFGESSEIHTAHSNRLRVKGVVVACKRSEVLNPETRDLSLVALTFECRRPIVAVMVALFM